MRALLLQLDGSYPNVALMRLSAHLKAQGHQVTFARATTPAAVARPSLWGEGFDAVYASCIFGRTRSLAEALRHSFPSAIIGGTGWRTFSSLASLGVTTLDQDYSLYPEFPHSIGFTQRGCRFRCGPCVVPEKEGRVRPELSIGGIWRGEPWPRNILLLDNDFFGQPDWRARVSEIRRGGFRVCLCQGINARTLSSEQADALEPIALFLPGAKRVAALAADGQGPRDDSATNRAAVPVLGRGPEIPAATFPAAPARSVCVTDIGQRRIARLGDFYPCQHGLILAP